MNNKYIPFIGILGVLLLAGLVYFTFDYISKPGAQKAIPHPSIVTVSPTLSVSSEGNIPPSPTGDTEKSSAAEGSGTVSGNLALTVKQPENNAVLTAAQLTVSGTTEPAAEVFINEIQTKADAKGNFSQRIELEEGENFITVSANDDAGNFAEVELKVTYTPSGS